VLGLVGAECQIDGRHVGAFEQADAGFRIVDEIFGQFFAEGVAHAFLDA